jgi:hypothetical protein
MIDTQFSYEGHATGRVLLLEQHTAVYGAVVRVPTDHHGTVQ